MAEFNKIHDKYYMYSEHNPDRVYTMIKDKRGMYSRGEAWRLRVRYGSAEPELVACFVTKDDGNRVYNDDYGKQLWTDESAFEEANRLLTKMENCI